MLETRFCERFGVAAPIVVAPMGPDLTGPELVAAVSNAGGFGILQAQLCPPPLLRDQISYLRTLTDKPFGVNFVLHFPHKAGIQVCIDERVAALSFLAASEEDTVRTILFGHGWSHAPHRTLRTGFVKEWVGRENETQDSVQGLARHCFPY